MTPLAGGAPAHAVEPAQRRQGLDETGERDRLAQQVERGRDVGVPTDRARERHLRPEHVRRDLITKDVAQKGKRMATRVTELEPARRREEIARMLAGAEITAEARAAAERLIRAAAG